MVMQRIFFSQCKILRWEQNRPKKWKNKPMSLDGRSVCCLSLILWFWIWKQNCTYANLQVRPVIWHQIYSNLRKSKNPNVCPSIQKKWQCSSQLACVSFKWKYWPHWKFLMHSRKQFWRICGVIKKSPQFTTGKINLIPSLYQINSSGK